MSDKPDDTSGEVSEVTGMTPGAGDADIPGTDDGIPPAQDTDHVMHSVPKDYGDSNEEITPR